MLPQGAMVLFLLTIIPVITAIDAFDDHTEEGLRLSNTNTSAHIEVHNPYRAKRTSIKFELDGARVSELATVNNTSWLLNLSDHSTALLTSDEKANGAVIEYNLLWNGGQQNEHRQVCFHYGFNNASWYSTYQAYEPEWPMNINRLMNRKEQFNFILPKNRLNHPEFFNILEHLFITSDGFAVLLDEGCPWFIQRLPIGASEIPVLCFSVNNTEPYMEPSLFHNPTFFDIKMRIFISTNVKTVTDYVLNESGYIPRPKSHPAEEMFKEPSWFNAKHMEEGTLLEYAQTMANQGYGAGNDLIINGNWEEKHGDFRFSAARFPNASSVAVQLTEQFGLRVSLSISPNVNSHTYRTQRYFLKNSDGVETNIVDFSNAEAAQWYSHLLRQLHFEYGITSFLVVAPKHFDYIFRASDPDVQRFPNRYIRKYLESISLNRTDFQLTSTLAFKCQHLPIFYQLFNFDLGTRGSLRSLIANVLSASMGGYSFVVPSTIGAPEVDEQLYIRWLQAIALMPRMQFSIPPWKYSDQVKRAGEKFIQLHQKYVPTMLDLAKRRVETGEPIIRPMWWVAPNDPRTYHISDQFMLGNDIIVAPVLERNHFERTVYLPADSWIGQNGTLYEGPGLFTVPAPLDELPYFKRAIY